MSTSSSSLVQLMDMGIPRARAQAALVRAKGDVMSAAERVFSGEFDHIASDVSDDGQSSNELPISPERLNICSGTLQPTNYEEDSNGDADEFDDQDDYGDSDDWAGDDDFDMEGFNDDARKRYADPYAGIFFSKQRTEKLVEPIEKPVFAVIYPTSNNSFYPERVRILGRGEWMSGCPEASEQSFLFQQYTSLADEVVPCGNGCGHEFVRKPELFFALFSDFPSYISHLLCNIHSQCPHCHSTTCMACGDSVGSGKIQRATTSNEEDLLFHCPNIQGVIIGVGLHMIEHAFSETVLLKSSTERRPTKKRRVKKLISKLVGSQPEPGSQSEGSDNDSWGGSRARTAKGTGYSGKSSEDRSGMVAMEEAQRAQDNSNASILAEVRIFLPSVKRGYQSDVMVHPTALAHLRRRSGFVNDLLRNDSLIDMSNRSRIYQALFDWLEIISSHESLATMLAMPQMRPVKTEPGPDDHTLYVTYEGAPSPRELLESVVIQATAALKGLSAAAINESTPTASLPQNQGTSCPPPVVDDEQRVALHDFCTRILKARDTIDQLLVETKGREFVARMTESLPKLYNSDDHKHFPTADDEQSAVAIYQDWASSVRFQYCDLINPDDETKSNYLHAFNEDIKKLIGVDHPKRSLAIAKELAILTTSLPAQWHSSVFLRVDETRVDCLKAMIIGPEGTPYENGCFIFDIFLPLDYNTKCPSVKSMTTNGGKYRYNPNLYADGKVCLSLLGTWDGPGWISGKSTLLQVLISIQSLILCDEPYTNEPGYSKSAGSGQSRAYSANVRRMVIRDAMGNNIKNPPFPFKEEIGTHFRLKAKAIRTQLDKWKGLDDGLRTTGDGFSVAAAFRGLGRAQISSDFDSAANQLRQMLDEFCCPNQTAL